MENPGPSKPDSDPIEKYTTAIKDRITLLAALVGVAYAAGFMVVSSSLAVWGITDLDILQARYVSAGLLFLLHATVALLPPALLMVEFLRPASTDSSPISTASANPIPNVVQYAFVSHSKRMVLISGLLTLLITTVLSFILFFVTSTNIWGTGSSEYFWRYFADKKWDLFLGWTVPMFICGSLLPLLISQNRLVRVTNLLLKLFILGLILLFLPPAIRTYSAEIYSHSSPAVGGGDYYLVKLTPAKDKEDTAAQVIDGRSSYRSKWIFLLDQSEKALFLLVLPPNCGGAKSPFDINLDKARAVIVQKSLIEGIRYYNTDLDGTVGCD